MIAVINLERIDTKILQGTPVTQQTGIGGPSKQPSVSS